jgi:hypothetical protein
MPFVTIHIASAGTPETDKTTSTAGHMWYSLDKGDGSNPLSYGFAPDENHVGQPFAPGQGYDNDNSKYIDTANNPIYTRTVEITQAQYDAMKNFGEAAVKASSTDGTISVLDVNGQTQTFSMRYNVRAQFLQASRYFISRTNKIVFRAYCHA